MDTSTDGDIPNWTLANRLNRSLEWAGVRVGEMATHLELSRGTIGAYRNGRRKPDARTLRLWATRTGVNLHWLETGDDPRTMKP